MWQNTLVTSSRVISARGDPETLKRLFVGASGVKHKHHGSSSALPAVVSVGFGRARDAAQEHRSVRGALQQSQRPGPRAEALPGQDPRVQLQEQGRRGRCGGRRSGLSEEPVGGDDQTTALVRRRRSDQIPSVQLPRTQTGGGDD